MKEIQDLTLNTSRGLEALEWRLKQRKEQFGKEWDRLPTPAKFIGFRFTGLPIEQRTHVQRVFDKGRIVTEYELPRVKVRRVNQVEVYSSDFLGLRLESYRPILRGARVQTRDDEHEIHRSGYAEVHEDGLLEIGFLSSVVECISSEIILDPDWAVGVFANLLEWIQ